MSKLYFFFMLCFAVMACENRELAKESARYQKVLVQLLPKGQAEQIQKWLFIPIDAACDGCRDRAMAYLQKNAIPQKSCVIISARDNKTLKNYFRQNKINLKASKSIVFDTQNYAFRNDLVASHPRFFYFKNDKLYKKADAMPVDLDKHLQEFFEP